jgi:hypothetical protein
MNLSLRSIFVHISQVILHVVKSYLGTSDSTSPLKEGVLWSVIALKNRVPRPGLNPRSLGTNDKHANHYTTDSSELLR